MKRIGILALGAILSLPAIVGCEGCAAKNTVQAPLPPGAINAFDATSYRVIMDAHAAIESIRNDVASGKITLTATQKAALNQIISDQNTAQDAYKAYHAGASNDTAALSAAVAKVTSDLANLATTIGGKQ